MAEKEFNFFYECAVRCTSVASGRTVHLFFLRGQLKLHIWQHNKFTEDANQNKQKWHFSQNKDLSGKWQCQTLKAFRITSSKMKISLLILSWWYFSCLHIQRISIQYTDRLFWKIIAQNNRFPTHYNGVTQFENLPKCWGDKIFSYIYGRINLYGGN